MATLRAINNRIGGIRKIQRIANALEVVAATKLRRRERLVVASRPYALGLREILENLMKKAREKHPLMEKRSDGETVLVVLTSDRGLCGAFNNNVIESVKKLSWTARPKLIVVGRKGISYFSRKGYHIVAQYRDLKDEDIGPTTQDITAKIISLYTEEPIKGIVLLYNMFRLHLIGKVSELQLLPVEVEGEETLLTDYLYEPSPDAVLDKVLSAYIAEEIRQIILESRASEEMARMVAMKIARDNADELIEKLSLDYHKTRQAGITKEMIELATTNLG